MKLRPIPTKESLFSMQPRAVGELFDSLDDETRIAAELADDPITQRLYVKRLAALEGARHDYFSRQSSAVIDAEIERLEAAAKTISDHSHALANYAENRGGAA